MDWDSFCAGAVAGWLAAIGFVWLLMMRKIRSYEKDDDDE
jgi:hypothetical protein